MNRRSFLSALGIAPVVGVAAALPTKAEQAPQPRLRAPAVVFSSDTIINFEDGRYWFETDERAAQNPQMHHTLRPCTNGFVLAK